MGTFPSPLCPIAEKFSPIVDCSQDNVSIPEESTHDT
uniref:Uncharacterized protein n=1 Tax=viral metagenome TaxID=1070528 RepID=A0A6C0AUQ3_9ZZZZ